MIWRNGRMIRRGLVIVLFLMLAGALSADIRNLKCTVTTPTDLNKTYNNNQEITLSATWQGDTSPYAATFKANGAAIGTSNTDGTTTTLSLSAAGVKEGDNTFSVSVIETSVPNATSSGDETANGTIKVDRTPPTLTLTVTSGNIVSPNQGTNEVILQFTSSEGLGEQPQFTVSPGAIPAPTPVGTPSPPFSSGQYKITVPNGTSGGTYVVSVTGRDNTEPASGRNSSTAQTSFVVDAAADGAPTISSVSPPSPCRSQNVVLTGSLPVETGAQRVEVLEGGAVKGTTSVSANADTWTITLTDVTEGTHKYSARRIDPLGNVSGTGTELAVVVDRTSPTVPTLASFTRPVNKSKVTVTGQAVTDAPHESRPLKVLLFRDGSQIASTTAGTDGRFSVDIDLEPGQNVILARAADTTWLTSTDSSGNLSDFSKGTVITLDQSGPTIVAGGIVISSGNGGGGTFLRPVEPSVPISPPVPPSAPPMTAAAPPVLQVPGAVGVASVAADAPSSPGDPATSAAVLNASATEDADGPFDLEADTTLAEEPEEVIETASVGGLAPPIGKDVPGPLAVRLPLAALADRSPGSVQGWVVCRQLGAMGAGGFFPLERAEDALEAVIPIPGVLAYRIMLKDAAGNVTVLPSEGEFLRQNRRCETLLVSDQGTMWNTAPWVDEWPVDPLGMPPLSRILAYRRLQVPPSQAEEMRNLLAAAGKNDVVEIVSLGAPAVSMNGYMLDLRLLREGRLPFERLDLLRREIVNLVVPTYLLPAPESLPDQPEFKSLREAIQFRHLHEKPR